MVGPTALSVTPFRRLVQEPVSPACPPVRANLVSAWSVDDFSARSNTCGNRHSLAPSPWPSFPTQKNVLGKRGNNWGNTDPGRREGDGGPKLLPSLALGYNLTPLQGSQDEAAASCRCTSRMFLDSHEKGNDSGRRHTRNAKVYVTFAAQRSEAVS